MSSRKVAQALGQPNIAQQLETQLQIDKTRILPKVAMSAKQKEAYLRDAPSGKTSIFYYTKKRRCYLFVKNLQILKLDEEEFYNELQKS